MEPYLTQFPEHPKQDERFLRVLEFTRDFENHELPFVPGLLPPEFLVVALRLGELGETGIRELLWVRRTVCKNRFGKRVATQARQMQERSPPDEFVQPFDWEYILMKEVICESYAVDLEGSKPLEGYEPAELREYYQNSQAIAQQGVRHGYFAYRDLLMAPQYLVSV